MDLSTLIGVIACLVLCIFGMIVGQQSALESVMSFVHGPSALITFGGALMATLTMSPSIKDYVNGFKSFGIALKKVEYDETEKIKQIIDLSNVARKEGLLALEEAANSSIDDEFMKKGILLIVDGTDPEFVRRILETELECIEDRHKSTITFWENLASMGPAWGMIGTLIGLILMLKDLQDISSVGPNMAVALVTTFYGSILANWICLPVAAKLKEKNSAEVMIKTIVVEGLLSIQAGENPRVIEEKLKSFIDPSARESLSSGGGEL
ncbi:MAG: motility protein A [Lachnospiraceae bacterium]|nr:motility protein A [Lachnospiraceae bacterium]